MGVRLFLGGSARTIQGEPDDITGDREFTAAHLPSKGIPRNIDPFTINALLDSGAFSDPPGKRMTPEAALERQLTWERKASKIWGVENWYAKYLVSYDLLIDETWICGTRHKRRWDINAAESAVQVTVDAAHYLARHRVELAPRTLVLSAQGVDALQYEECTVEVLKVAQPGDWFGLGGWCILGIHRSWMPTFWQTMRRVLPLVKQAGIEHVHIFGVLWTVPLGGLLWLADQHGLTVSTDSKGPIAQTLWKDTTKAKPRMPYWRDNVAWWRNELATLRTSEYYKEPPLLDAVRQHDMFDLILH